MSMEDAQASSPATEVQTPAGENAPTDPPGFSARGRMRRRARFLRKARELAYRDLGGLVFDLHRFGKRNDSLVLAKLETIGRIDGELRSLEATLDEHQPVTVLREAGVAACPRCAAIHGSDDRFCPNCGLAMDLRAERPVAGAAAPAPAPPAAPTPPPAPAPTPAPARTTTAVHPSASAPAAPPAPASPATAAPATGQPASTPPATASPTAPDEPPARSTTTPAGPAPGTGDAQAETKKDHGRPSVDQPTEIVRPSAKKP